MLFHNDQATIFRSAQKFGTYVALTFEPFWIGKHSDIEADDRTAKADHRQASTGGDYRMETPKWKLPGTFTFDGTTSLELSRWKPTVTLG